MPIAAKLTTLELRTRRKSQTFFKFFANKRKPNAAEASLPTFIAEAKFALQTIGPKGPCSAAC